MKVRKEVSFYAFFCIKDKKLFKFYWKYFYHCEAGFA